MTVEYLVVGSGLTGAVIARSLVDAGHRVKILERRSHVGGNVHDHKHESGIMASDASSKFAGVPENSPFQFSPISRRI